MALRKCINKAGKALDVEDRNYMKLLLSRGRDEVEILDRLEHNILKEQKELIELMESQGIAVKVESSPKVKVSPKARILPKGEEDSTVTTPKANNARKESSSEEESPDKQKLNIFENEDLLGINGESSFTKSTPKKIESLTKAANQKINNFLNAVAPHSELLSKFLEMANITDSAQEAVTTDGSSVLVEDPVTAADLKKNPKAKNTDAFEAATDTVVVSQTAQRETGRDLDLNNEADAKEQATILDHEIVHAFTAPYIKKIMAGKGTMNEKLTMQYLVKAVNKLIEMRELEELGGLSKLARERLANITEQSTLWGQINELVAVMGAETDVANEIYEALGGNRIPKKTLLDHINKVLAKVRDTIMNWTKEDFDGEVDVDKLQTAIFNTIANGVSFKQDQQAEFNKWRKTDIDTLGLNTKPTPSDALTKYNLDYINQAVASMINSPLERRGKKLLGQVHHMMWMRFPMYQDVVSKINGVYDSSPALQQFLHTVTGEGVDKIKKADILAKFAAIGSQRTEIINDQMSRLNRLSANLSKEESATLNALISDTPLHDYFVMADELRTVEDIDAEVERLTKAVRKKNPQAIRDIQGLVDWNVNDKHTGTIYNLESADYNTRTGKFGKKVHKLLALKSIQAVGTDKFVDLLQYGELMDAVRDNSVANKLATIKNEGTAGIKDSLIPDEWKEQPLIKVVDKDDFRMYENGEETGWKVLKEPKRGELGIVYKYVVDSTDVPGAFTDINLSSTDVTVPKSMRNRPGVVKAGDGYKFRLTKEQKRTIGLNEDFAQGLVRGTAHSIAIQESQIIRDEMLRKETRVILKNKKSLEKLSDTIADEGVDNPWFVKLNDISYESLPDDIKAKYMKVKGRASNVKGFNQEVDLVRKDISHWLLGGNATSLFQNPHMKWATRILKNLVSGAKIGMVVLNPVKIANDNLSNLAYLGVLGVSPLFIAKNYKDISTSFAEYSEIQRQIFQLKIQLVSRPNSTKAKKQLKSLQKRLERNSVGDIGDKGFVNSLGSDLVSRSADTLSGFQADMHRGLEYLLHDKNGHKRYVSHFIMRLQKIGFQAEDFFSYIGGVANSTKSAKLLGQELDQVAARLKEIKTDEDIVNYVSQFTTSPSSEAVRFGSAMTDLTDVLAKETLYRHLVENVGMSESDARIKVLDSFPDYKENMPLAVKQLSDAGIIMFPSFWLRIQKSIYRMMRDKPINLASELMIQEAVGSDINTIFDANIINKSESFGGVFHTPFESIGTGSVIPDQIFG